MNVDQFITKHFQDMQDVCRAYLGETHLSDDMLQEAIMTLLEKRTDRRLQEIIKRGEGMYYFTGIAKMMLTSRHKFCYTFINTREISGLSLPEPHHEAHEKDERFDRVDKIISSMRWYKQELWRLYFDEKYSFTKLSEETGIDRNELYKDITKLKEEVKELLNENNS